MTEDDLPDRRKHGYKDLEEKLDAHVEEIEETQRRFFIGGLIVLAVIGISTALSLFGFGILLKEQGDQQNQIEAQQMELKEQAQQIQQQRETSISDDCKRTNLRHDTASKALTIAAKADQANAPNAEARQEIRRRRDVTLGLIDFLSPVQDCKKVVSDSVQPIPSVEPTPEEKKEQP